MSDLKSHSISRREFGRRAAMASVASLVPASALPTTAAIPQPAPQPQGASALTPESQAETDARTQTVLALYGGRLSEPQKLEIARLSASAQRSLDRLRAYSVQNSDDPALYFKPLIEHERKTPSPIPAPSSAPSTGLIPPTKKP